jgi:hypothetical protein
MGRGRAFRQALDLDLALQLLEDLPINSRGDMVLENDLEGVLGPNYYGVVTLACSDAGPGSPMNNSRSSSALLF